MIKKTTNSLTKTEQENLYHVLNWVYETETKHFFVIEKLSHNLKYHYHLNNELTSVQWFCTHGLLWS